ncbi:Gr5a, partial [Drosophila busckii]
IAATQRRGTRRNFQHDGSFQQAVAPVLLVAQCFCLMPVQGLSAYSVRKLHFTWRSWRTCWSLAFIVSSLLDTVFNINLMAHNALDVRNVEPIVFDVSILMGSYLFLQLARQWPTLMQHWARVEQQLPSFESWRQQQRLARRIRRVAFGLFGISLMEHLLSIISAVYYDYCPARRDPIESYFYKSGVHFFHVFPYSNWLGWLAKVQNVLLTFAWSYLDIFVMIMGIGISELFSRLTLHLQPLASRVSSLHTSTCSQFVYSIILCQSMPEIFWTYARTRYRAIVELILDVDDAISGIMLISFGSNLYFVCLQVLKSINKMPSAVHAVYFYFSICFLIGRSVAVLLYVSAVHDHSRAPLRLLREVPRQSYQEEQCRFASELVSDEIALTGLKFFSITRKLFLSVAGSIVTYELVLIQFHEDKKTWDC